MKGILKGREGCNPLREREREGGREGREGEREREREGKREGGRGGTLHVPYL